ncbi:MAG TPA: hypothetical protein VNE82_02045 [Candidatus Binataceae bacterium]|nr:hypothetical protein [Candidatus Binataceae bacterium]
MSEHENPARQQHSEPQSHTPEPPEPEHLTTAEKSLMRRLTEVLRFADFMALLMVAATAFSAYATWRTAQVTSHIFAMEERPFIGVERVTFEQGDTPNPRAVVEYRNFGKIPASGAILTVIALADGKRVAELPNEMSSISAGVLSPSVPHFFYRYFPVETYKSIVSGKTSLMLHVRAEYRGPGGETFCYTERLVFDYRSAGFRPAGGTDRCRQSDIY